MSDIFAIAGSLTEELEKRKVEKYSFTVSESEKNEFNVENGSFTLLRTVLGSSASAAVFLGSRKGTVSGNDVSPEGLSLLADSAVAAASSAPEDPCHDLAPDQGSDVFRCGIREPDLDLFFDRIRELLDTIGRDYPLVHIGNVIASFTHSHLLYRNTNGTQFEDFTGFYEIMLEFSGNDGTHTTSLDYAYVQTADLGQPLIELSTIRMRLANAQKSLEAVPMQGKFEGTVIFTPDCLGSFLGMLVGSFSSDSTIMDKTSLWLDKVGERVADESVTICFSVSDPRLVGKNFFTQNGFRSEDVAYIENGILKTHILSLYAANKTGRPVTRNSGSGMIMKPGTVPLADLIASVKKGLLVGGFSGGYPGANGEFSGVAKNSFLIEDGKITTAVTETMINGNLSRILLDVKGISSETACDGSSVLPWLATEGIVISGK